MPFLATSQRKKWSSGNRTKRPRHGDKINKSSSNEGKPKTNVDANTSTNLSEGAPLEAPDMRCMSVFIEGDKIAFACYIEAENAILLDQSHANGHDTQAVVELFLSTARPSLVLGNSKIATNAELLRVLTTPTTLSNIEQADTPKLAEEEARGTIPFKILKSGVFDLKSCRALILGKLRVLSLLRQNQHHRIQMAAATRVSDNIDRRFGNSYATPMATTTAYNSLAALIDFESTALVRALGSLVSYLQDTTFRMEEGFTVTVNSVTYAKSAHFMRIDATTLHSLHIFSTEHHPLIAKGSGNAKEGFSLFTLLDRCRSKIGKQCLREWMLKPVLDPIEILRRQDGIELFLCPELNSLVGVLLNLLQQVGAVDKILLRIQKCHASPVDFLTLSATLKAAVAICNVLTYDFKEEISNTVRQIQQRGITEAVGAPPLGQIASRSFAFLDSILERCYVPGLQDLYERITSVVDEEMTAQVKDSLIIQHGFNEELDNAKAAFDGLSDTLSAVGTQVLEKYPALRQLKVVFLPQVGFLITLDKRHHVHNELTNEFAFLPETFTFVFIQHNDAYFKNEDMRQLDSDIGDLDSFIKDTENLIKSELEDDILDSEGELRSTFSALAELDCILSLTSCAADLHFTRPEIVQGNSSFIYIENGRHPLQELIIEGEFIKNDTMVDEENRVNIITGSNFSGKSCYTRQVGVLVYLAHIGSFLPCDRAKISITDQILARISSVETCAVPQSSFQLDLTQMAVILRQSTPKTLVLIDEFGKGTAPASGIAVLTAALRKLSNIGCKVICTTHFLEIFSLQLLLDNKDGISVLRMAVQIPESEGDSDAVSLFRLEKGIATTSAGLACARTAGVTTSVLSRAKEILDATKEGKPVPPIPESLNLNSALQRRAKLAIRTFLSVDNWTTSTDDELFSLEQNIASM